MPKAVDGISPEKKIVPTVSEPVRPPQRRPRQPWRLPRWFGKLAYVVGCFLLLLLILYIYNYRSITGALSNAQSGLSSMESGFRNLLAQPKSAQRDFTRAEKFFTASATNLKSLDLLSKAIFTLPAARNQLALLKLGHSAASSGEIIAKLLEDPPPKAAGDFAQTMGATTSWLNRWQAKNQDNLSQLLVNLKSMENASQQTYLKDRLPKLTRNGQSLLEILRESPDLFGSRGDRRYMIIFQNNSELRPTGGFIGSYATLLFRQDGTAAFNFGPNIYHATPNLSTWEKVATPYPLPVHEEYGLPIYDANWDPNFPTTAQLLLKYYESIHGASAQGVIALDTSLITDLLAITGPIDFPQYSTTLTADNFLTTVQFKVEQEYFTTASNVAENNPKKILSDLIPVLFQRINQLDWAGKQKIYQLISEAAGERSIQFFSQNARVEQQLVALGLAGEIKQTSSDYLHLNNANVVGHKSSLNINQKVLLTHRIIGQRIQATLSITRTHTGDGQWPDADNRNYMRIYLPLGSELVATSGAFEKIDVKDENGHLCISGWFSTPVADKRNADIVYLLPESISKHDYSLTWQRQAGDNPTEYQIDSPILGKIDGTLKTDKTFPNE